MVFMANIGVISNDVITKTRIFNELKEAGHHATVITSPFFDSAGFDLIIVDLEAPMALLVLKNYFQKCLAFASASDESKLDAARQSGCTRVYKNGVFFKKVLPNFKLP